MGSSAKGALSAGTMGLYNPKSERTSTSKSVSQIDPALRPLQGQIIGGAMNQVDRPYYGFGQTITQQGPSAQDLRTQLATASKKDKKLLASQLGVKPKQLGNFIQNYKPEYTVSGDRQSGVADLNPSMLAAINAFGSAPQVTAASIARGDIRDVMAERFPDANLNDYMNPYITNVVDIANQDLDRARQIERAQTMGQASINNAFGGSRTAVLEAENNRGYYDAAQRQSAALRAQGFDAAANLVMQDANRALEAGGMNQGMDFNVADRNAQLAQQAAIRNAELMAQNNQANLAAQGLLQANTQDKLSFDYNEFLREQGYPQQQLSFLTGIASGVPQGQVTNQTAVGAPNTAGNFFNNFANLASGMKSIYGMGG